MVSRLGELCLAASGLSFETVMQFGVCGLNCYMVLFSVFGLFEAIMQVVVCAMFAQVFGCLSGCAVVACTANRFLGAWLVFF